MKPRSSRCKCQDVQCPFHSRSSIGTCIAIPVISERSWPFGHDPDAERGSRFAQTGRYSTPRSRDFKILSVDVYLLRTGKEPQVLFFFFQLWYGRSSAFRVFHGDLPVEIRWLTVISRVYGRVWICFSDPGQGTEYQWAGLW